MNLPQSVSVTRLGRKPRLPIIRSNRLRRVDEAMEEYIAPGILRSFNEVRTCFGGPAGQISVRQAVGACAAAWLVFTLSKHI